MTRTIFAFIILLALFACSGNPKSGTGIGDDIFELCAKADSAQIVKAIEAVTNLEMQNDSGLTLLMIAAKTNPHLGAIRVLINAGANVNAMDTLKKTPLYYAAWYNSNPDIVNMLIEKGTNNYAIKTNRNKALLAAAEGCNKAVVKMLAYDANYEELDIENNRDEYDMNPIMYAACNCEDPEIVEMLIDANGSVGGGKGNGSGTTPLMYAAENNPNPAVIQVLIENGADVNATDFYNNDLSVMGYAVRNKNPKIAEALIAAGVKDDRLEESFVSLCESGTPAEIRKAAEAIPQALKKRVLTLGLENAVWNNENIEVSKVLFELGAKDDEEVTKPLLLYAVQKNAEFVKLFLKNGSNPNADYYKTGTMLNYAVYGKDTLVIPLLIKAGADVNKASEYYNTTPLILAGFVGNMTAAKQLIEAGANINAQDHNQKTALHNAISCELGLPMVKFLVEHGTDISIKDIDGNTALDIARAKNCTEIVICLEKLYEQ